MSSGLEWKFENAVPSSVRCEINGINVWDHKWTDTGRHARVQDPRYFQDFDFYVYQIKNGDAVITFAAGEFSNGMWGFFVKNEND